MKFSDVQLTALAKSKPEELARILTTPKTDIRTLSFGIEILATEAVVEDIVLPPLKMLLKHVHAVVREGALIGVQAFYGANRRPPADIIARLASIAEHDPSPACKELAHDLIQEWKDE
jgi:hypothetical protein